MYEILNLKIEELGCTHCKEKIKNIIKHIQGILNVDVDNINKKLTIKYNPKIVEVNIIENTIASKGYRIINKSGIPWHYEI